MGRMMIDSSGSQPFTITGAPVAVSELKTIVLAQRAISAQIEVNKLIETLLVVALKQRRTGPFVLGLQERTPNRG